MEGTQREEQEHKIEQLKKENVQLMTRIIELREFIFRLSQEIQEYIDTSSFQDRLNKRPSDRTR